MAGARPVARPRESLSPLAYEPLSRIEVSSFAFDEFDRLRLAIEESLPEARRFARTLPEDIRALWRSLTSERDSRQAGYLSSDAALHAYARYFLPWNVLKLSAFFGSRDFDGLAPPSVLDLGSGPLTLPIALWLSRPELRAAPIELTCVDLSHKAMDAGRRVLETLAVKVGGAELAWKVRLVRASAFDFRGKDFALVASANVFNEHFWSTRESLGERAARLASTLSRYAAPWGRIFAVEPGDPRSGTLVAALRDAFLELGRHPIAPCPHSGPCPMPGFRMTGEERERPEGARFRSRTAGKRPWCHVTVPLDRVPEWLARLSRDAGLEKEKLVASWLYVAGLKPPKGSPGYEKREVPTDGIPLRVVSAPFAVPGGQGCYSCTYKGYSLLRTAPDADPRSGDRVLARELVGGRDEVSGARIFE